MSDVFPKKYWWLVLVAVPLGVAVIAILPPLFKDDGGEGQTPGNTINISGSEIGGDVQIVGTQILVEEIQAQGLPEEQVAKLERQLAEVKALVSATMFKAAADTLDDIASAAPSAALYNDLGALRFKEGDHAAARSAFQAGLELDPDYEALRLNQAQLDLAEGDAVAALKGLATAGDSAEVRQLRSHVEQSVTSGAIEREPNDNRRQPNQLPVGQWVSARISDQTDQDVFRIRSESLHRDYVAVELDNHDSGFRYVIRVYGENKRELDSFEASTDGQDGRLEFSVLPRRDYLVAVMPYVSAGGSYQLRVVYLERYDRYETNDELLQAAELKSLDPVEASIMDRHDHDYFRLPEVEGKLTISLTNESSGLRGDMTLFSPDRRILRNVRAENEGHDLELSYKVEAEGRYYLSLRPYVSRGGKYRLDFDLQ